LFPQHIEPPVSPPLPPFHFIIFFLQFLFVELFSPVCDPLSLFSLGQLSIAEVFALLGCYAAYVGSCLPTFRDCLSIPYSRIKQSKKSSSIGFSAENKPGVIEVLRIARQIVLLRLKMDGILDPRSTDFFYDSACRLQCNATQELKIFNICLRMYADVCSF
jgi:hypothetical protein